MTRPVECIRCQSKAVILSRTLDGRWGEERWRYRCLDDGAAWWVDEHGGQLADYVPRPR